MNNFSLPLVSIITVSLNSEDYIEEAVKSVLNQSYEKIEYIVVDGGSTDSTLQLLETYIDRIDILISEKDTGIYNAMNKGLHLASGDYVLFLNSDDWYRHDAVELLVNMAIHTGAQITHANAAIINARGLVTGRIEAFYDDAMYTRGATLRHETMLVEKSIYEAVGGYDESYKIISDFLFMAECRTRKLKVAHLDRDILFFRNTGISHASADLLHDERKRYLNFMFPFLNSEDCELLCRRRDLNAGVRQGMIERYANKSALFVRSMESNIQLENIFEIHNMPKYIKFHIARYVRYTKKLIMNNCYALYRKP
jgi:glycosyltransferase involved in cell wall biosynthesis